VGAEPVIAPSARKHGVNDKDILHAYANPIRVFDLGDGLTMLIGGSTAAGVTPLGRRCRCSCHAHPRIVPEVMMMPRTVQDILNHGDELAKRFEDYEPDADDQRTTAILLPCAKLSFRARRPRGSVKQAVTEHASTATPGAPSDR